MCCLRPFAQSPLRFQHITTENGLSDNGVTCLLEDRDGFIWIGTERGLNRYDGQRIEVFPSGSDGPRGSRISSIAEDARGDLWITTVEGGLSRRDRDTGRFIHLSGDTLDPHGALPEGLNHVLVVNDSLLVLSSRSLGAVWFHLRKGVLFRRGFREPVLNDEGDTLFSADDNWAHSAFRLDERHLVLTMLRSRGPHIVDAVTGEETALLAPAGLVTHAGLVDGTLYMGGWTPGLFRGRPEVSAPVDHIPLDEEITDLIPWHGQQLLLATKVNGLIRSDTGGKVMERYQHERTNANSLVSDRTTCLLRDRAGNLWAGTSKGLSVHAPSVWRCETVPLLSGDQTGDLVFHAIQQDDDGVIRISTSKGFLLVDPVSLSSRRVNLEHGGASLEVTGLHRTAANEFYVGTETGIFRYDPREERILRHEETGKWEHNHAGIMFQARAVMPASIDGRAVLLAGALGYGHIAIDQATGEQIREWTDYGHQGGTMMLRSTVQDARGVFWSATAAGVVRWTPVGVGQKLSDAIFSTNSGPDQRLQGNDAHGLALCGDTVWVALRGAGLASIAGGRTRAHSPPPHMPQDLLGVTVDRSGLVWCTTGNGLLRYSPASDAWSHIPVNDGRDFRQLTQCITTLQDGRVAFCADDHLLLLDPAGYDAMVDLPVPRVVGLSNTWGVLEAEEGERVELAYRNSSLDVMLTALQPVGAGPLTFLCRLDDEPEARHAVSALDPLRFAGVPVGTHRLLVRVRDAYGREGPEHALLTITVVGPFWQHWWFFLLVLGAGALAMYLLSRFQQRQRARIQQVRDRIARDLHDDIGSTLGSINFYSEALKRKLSDTDHAMAQQVAERIGTSSREMVDQMSDIVWSVDPKNDDAAALGARLRAFAGDMLATRNIALDFRTTEAVNERKLSAEQRRNVFLICKEVLYNTVKYAEAKHVVITMATSGRALEISIVDDGKGFDPQNTDSYNGNGLPNMRIRAEAIRADLVIDSAPGRGTSVRITLAQQVFTPRSGD